MQNNRSLKTTAWRWQRHTFRAMNTEVQTHMYSNQVPDNTLLRNIEQLFTSFEKRLSRFDLDSELSRLNACEQDLFHASPTLIDALEAAFWAASITDGLYDPTILSYLEEAGYDRSFEQVQNPMPLHKGGNSGGTHDANRRRLGQKYTFQSIQINRPKREVYKPAGMRLDLGGMGKGWTVDRAADALQGAGPFLINAGGDIFAYHSPPGTKGWEINLVHPLQPDQFMAKLYLHHRALATSTIAKRRWRQNGQIMHHLINPRTGQPAQTDALSVTVIADRTMLAEVYAKVALILGADTGFDYLNNLPGVEGLIYTTDGEIRFTDGLMPMLI